ACGATTGGVTFIFQGGGDSETWSVVGAGKSALAAADAGVAHPSDASGALGAGSYAYSAHYAGDGNYKSSDSTCEPFSIDQADSSTGTASCRARENVTTVGGSAHLETDPRDKAPTRSL